MLFVLTEHMVIAQQDSLSKELFSLSLEDFLNVEIVSASKFNESAKNTPSTALVITQDDIKAYGYSHINEIIENIPGFYLIDDLAFNGAVPGVRGYWSGNSRNIIILVNGNKAIDNYSSGYRLRDNAIPVEAIDRIEVIRGPLSVIYGSGAFYGVVNIVTNESPNNLIAASYGSLNTKKIIFRSAKSFSDNIKYSFNASISHSDGMNHNLNHMGSNIQDNIPNNTQGRLENRDLYLNYSFEFNGFTFKTNYYENPREIYFFFPSASDGYLNRQSGSLVAAGFKKEFSDFISLNSNIAYSKQVLRAEADYYNTTYFGKENIETEGFEGELNTLITLDDDFDITTGVNCRVITDIYDPFDHPRLLSDTIYTPSVSNTITRLADNSNIATVTAFSQISFNPHKNLNLVAGIGIEKCFEYDILRINGGGSIDSDDYQELKGTYNGEKVSVIPRLAAIYSLTKNHTFKLLYGQAINNPSFQQNWTQFVFETYGSELKPEKIRTLEFNYLALPFDFLSINFSLFRNNLNQLITRTHDFDSAGNYITFNSNAGKMSTNGLELLIKYTPLNNLKTEFGFTYQQTKNNSKGFEEVEKAYSPNLLGYIKASYKIKNISFGLTGNYVDEMETYWDISILKPDGNYGERIGKKVEGYYVVSANINADNILNKGLYLNLKCYNILNQEIRYPTFTNNSWANLGTLGHERLFTLTFGWNFNSKYLSEWH